MLLLLRKTTLILLLTLIDFVPSADSEESANANDILIGALLDDNYRSEETSTAFLYEISSQNEKHPNLKMKSEDPIVFSMTNNFVIIKKICQLMANGTFVFFPSHTMSTTDAIKSYSSTFRMPFISSEIAINNTDQEFGYELYLRPYYVKAIADFIKHKNWKNIWYLYDSDAGLERWRQLTDGFSQNAYSVKMRIYRVENSTDAYVTLKRLTSRKDEEMTLLLDFPTRDCEEVIKKLNIETRAIYHHYFIVGLGIDDMHLEALQMNVVGLRLVDSTNRTVQAFLRNWSLLNPDVHKGAGRNHISYEAALAVDAVGVISRALQRMISEKPTVFKQMSSDGKAYNNGSEGINCDAEPVQIWQHGYDMMKAMKEIEFGGLTGDIKFDKFGLRRDYKLDIVEATSIGGLVKVGHWHSEKGLYIQTVIGRPKGQMKFTNRTRIITSMVTEPYLILNGTSFKGNDVFKGYCADLAREIANIISFNYVISPAKDGSFGRKGEDGTWNGMVGELIRHEADMAIAPLTITADRQKVIDFSKPFMSTGLSIMMKKPIKQLRGPFAFLYPFSNDIWLCTIFGFFGVQVILFLVNRLSEFGSLVKDKKDVKKFKLLSCQWVIHEPGRSIPGRVVKNVWSLATIILMSLYTAKLYTLLKTERTQLTIESANDLVSQTEIKYGLIHGGSTEAFFRQSTIPVYERMWAVMTMSEPSAFVSSTEEGADRVRHGKYAFLGDSTAIDYINARAPCDTMTVGSTFNIRGYGIAMPIGSDLRDRINLAVLELAERGILHKLQYKWWHDRSECPNGDVSKRINVGGRLRLSSIAGLFYILIGCLVLGMIILVFERWCGSPTEARTRKALNANCPEEKQVEALECF